MTTHQTHANQIARRNPDSFVRLALKLDAVASGAVGVLMLLAASMVIGGEHPKVGTHGQDGRTRQRNAD